ncbi:MAG: HAD-IIB family hydrolase [Deltaproteobacteria bacterium]|nr:HAD-IIB family hydrolase [Deltaproteobacteria bacterium]
MRYHALAADYDGTLAHHGVIEEATWAALRKLRESGRKLVMVTGRELDELLAILQSDVEIFDRIVAENGALIYQPSTKQIRTLAEPPPTAFIDELRRRGVDRVAAGRVIVATWEPHEDTVFHAIHELGLELQVLFNKGAVMVLPTGVNKATGLQAALRELGLSPHNVVAIGDAENDHCLLAACECAVAVANALPVLKDKADVLTRSPHGQGVSELITHILRDDLAAAAPRLTRHQVLIGHGDGGEVCVDPYAANILVCGTSGSGKSTLATGILERLGAAGYQFAILDPEGDFTELEDAVVLGGPQRVPLIEEIVDVLRDPSDNLVINMLGVALEHRPEFFVKLMPALADLRTRTGRPHWLVVDEAHHLLPASWGPAAEGIALRPHGTIYLTVHPGSVAMAVLELVDTVVAVGAHPDQTIRELCEAAGLVAPAPCNIDKLPPGSVLHWRVGTREAQVVRTELPKGERTRHSRKYTEGNLGHDRSFYFKGPDGKLNLKAHNLQLFLHIADGIDDETWLFHLRRGDYSTWLRTEVKDAALADEVVRVERAALDAKQGRLAIRDAVEKRYTLPSDKPSGIIDPVVPALKASVG